jgi:hypothetical protein
MLYSIQILSQRWRRQLGDKPRAHMLAAGIATRDEIEKKSRVCFVIERNGKEEEMRRMRGTSRAAKREGELSCNRNLFDSR